MKPTINTSKKDDIWLEELEDKYGLTPDVIKETVVDAISKSLSKIFRCEVEAIWDGKGIEIYKFRDTSQGLEVQKLSMDALKKNIFRAIRYEIARELSKKKVLSEYELAKDMTGTVVGGYVKEMSREKILVDIEGKGFTGVCYRSHQPPRERGQYKRGGYYSFYVLRVEPVLINRIKPELEIRLSRTSKSLPEGLLQKELRDMGLDTKVKCRRRIAGAFSYITTSQKIPKEAILSVSKELKERIIVSYVRKEKK